MSSTHFQTFEHTIPCQHIREYPRATKKRQEETLQLVIKQYKPLRNLELEEEAVTIVAAHANGFPKEAYEPLWDDLLQLSDKFGFKIRNIWIADQSNEGASGVLNEHLQGDDPSYFDHSRDLLQMVNTFREQMPRPIIGIGHSFGAVVLMGLSIIHPRLFTSLVLMEPIIDPIPTAPMNAAMPSSFRSDLWPSLFAATSAFRKNKFFASLDPRVLDNIIKYGLRKIPTAVYPISEKVKEGSYTLTTTKHQEVWSSLRSNLQRRDPASGSRVDRLLVPDMNPAQRKLIAYRGEMCVAFEYLPYLRPSTLFIFGGKTHTSTWEQQETKVGRTGTGLGGSGGVKAGQVEKYVFEKLGHMAPFEDIGGCAGVIGEWMGRKLTQFREDEEIIRNNDPERSDDMLVMSKKWLEMVKLPVVLPKTEKANL